MDARRELRLQRLRRLEGRELAGGRYALERLVGVGATGGVFRARQRGLPRPVAVKVIRTDSVSRRRRFLREVVAMSAVSHPSLPVIFEHGVLGERSAYVVMEWVAGRSCARLQARQGPLDAEDALRVVSQVVAALGALHAANVVHRDVKPANVLVDTRQRVLPTQLVDLGIARLPVDGAVALAPMTLPGRVVGTPGFMAPEQAAGGNVDARSDLWSAGMLLRWLCTGHCEADLDDSIPAPLRHVVRVATRLLPDGRPGSADELLGLLEDAAGALRRDSVHSAPTVLFSRRDLRLDETLLLPRRFVR